MLDTLQGEPLKHRLAITLLLYTGLRRGELLGLEWRDISWDNGTISVERASQYIKGQGIFTKVPKTKGSIRKLSLPLGVMDLLRQYRVWQIEQRLIMGDKWIDTGRLFTTEDGGPMHPDSLFTWFNRLQKKNGLPHISLHGLRHTSATVLITSGVDIRTVSQRLGHQQASITIV